MTKEELATERNEVREILEGFSEELSQSNLDKLSRVFCIINGDEKRIEELKKQLDWKEKALAKAKKETKRIADRVNKDKKRLIRRKSELEAQIEKMKCCSNCKNEGDYKEPYRYGTGWCNICTRHKVAKGNFDKWEIREK